ncbi:unnamed protein product [Knipowitschia caucasica]
MDITIQKGSSLPELNRCTDCCSLFHCPFCGPAWFLPNKKSRVQAHMNLHFNRAVKHEDYTIHRCSRQCRHQPHYHCIHCGNTVLRKSDFQRHLQLCNAENAAEQQPPVNVEAPEPMTSTPVPKEPPKPLKRKKTPTRKGIVKRPKKLDAIKPVRLKRKKCDDEDEASPDTGEDEEEDVQRDDALPKVKRCTDCCTDYHCPLCGPKCVQPCPKAKTEAQGHRHTSIHYDGYTIHRCRHSCRSTPHFHCPYCVQTVIRTYDFKLHLKTCKTKDSSAPASLPPSAAEESSESISKTTPKRVVRRFRRDATRLTCSAVQEYEKPSETVHISVQKGDSLPDLQKCSACNNFHCPFCSPKALQPTKKSRIEGHLKTHLHSAVRYTDTTIHRCRLLCRGLSHYHCCFCNSTILRTMDFVRHLELCKSKDQSSVVTATPLDSPGLDVSELAIASFKNRRLTLKDAPKRLQRAKCPKCQVVCFKKNLKKHMERWHSLQESDISSTLKSECVDPQNGIYAVHNVICGVSRPLHVQIIMQGETECVACDSTLCQRKLELARAELKSCKCKHLQAVANCRTFLSPVDLPQASLTEMAKRKVVGKSKIKMCVDRQVQATQHNVPLSVQLLLGEPTSKKFVSVYEPNIFIYSRLRRVIVSYNERRNVWYCPCSTTKKTCGHKHVARWHLFQTEPNLFNSSSREPSPSKPRKTPTKTPSGKRRAKAKPLVEKAGGEVESDVEDTPLESIETMEAIESIESIVAAMETSVSAATYPPKDVQMIKSMVQFLLLNKRIPALLPDHLSLPVDKDYPQHLIPAETNCLYCADGIALSQPVLITPKAKILMYSRILQDVSTYYKFCPRCGVPYRYQEWGEGLHNFNDHLLLDLPLCLMIRNTLQAQTTFGQIVESLKANKGAAFPSPDALLQAYLHFEALTDTQNQYSCVTYGTRPPVVVSELHNKAFHMTGRDLAEPTTNVSGPGDMDHLWKALREERVARGLVFGTKKPVLYTIM